MSAATRSARSARASPTRSATRRWASSRTTRRSAPPLARLPPSTWPRSASHQSCTLPSAPTPVSWTGVPSANPKVTGASPANVLSPELSETAVAWGSLALDGATSAVPYYGYDGFTAPTVLTQAINEAHKTEPDKNTYLVL